MFSQQWGGNFHCTTLKVKLDLCITLRNLLFIILSLGHNGASHATYTHRNKVIEFRFNPNKLCTYNYILALKIKAGFNVNSLKTIKLSAYFLGESLLLLLFFDGLRGSSTGA